MSTVSLTACVDKTAIFLLFLILNSQGQLLLLFIYQALPWLLTAFRAQLYTEAVWSCSSPLKNEDISLQQTSGISVITQQTHKDCAVFGLSKDFQLCCGTNRVSSFISCTEELLTSLRHASVKYRSF